MGALQTVSLGQNVYGVAVAVAVVVAVAVAVATMLPTKFHELRFPGGAAAPLGPPRKKAFGPVGKTRKIKNLKFQNYKSYHKYFDICENHDSPAGEGPVGPRTRSRARCWSRP